MNSTKRTLLGLAVAAALGSAGFANANTTTSAIRGQITGPQGQAAAGTKVVITHVGSGTSKTVMVNEAGLFSAQGLRVGGPYRVVLDSDNFKDATINDVFLNLGDTYEIDMSLKAQSEIETIVVTGSAVSAIEAKTGPSTIFDRNDIDAAPAINRDIKDIVRQDPRVYLDETGSDAIQCAGSHPRFNSLTLDGVRMNDRFGLNSNGYPTTRIPFSYDAIDQVAVELAPFDVVYGGFTACNFNAVTKSGENEVHGGVFYDYTSDSLRGDKADGQDFDNGDYTEKRYGFNVGLPLIKDELFLFAAYEKLEGAQLFEYPGLGTDVTTAELDRIRQIASDKYNYDIGGNPASMPVEDEKLIVKLDWNINETHRAAVTYNYNDGFALDQSDESQITFDSHFYERGAEFTSLVGALYSDWTEDFSTELRIESSELDNRQQSLDAASGFAEARIEIGNTDVYIGPDDSRQSNDLNWENFSVKLAGTYYLGNHKIIAGYEYEELDIFNLFMQHTVGEYRFGSIDDFEAGTPYRIYYNNSAGTNNPNDVAASFSYAQNTVYLQDEYVFDDVDLTIMAGLRYDWYTSDDSPRHNQNFQDRYGFSNSQNFDGVDILQPRVGFSWVVSDQLEVHGGIGLYSGGNPNVWISNSYSNDGITQIALQDRTGESLFGKDLIGQGRPIYDIPQALFDQVANTPVGSGDGDVNAINPDFEVPSEWKYAIGATYETDNEYVLTADLLYTRKQDSALINNIAYGDSGRKAPDGRPIFEQVQPGRFSDFMLTNVQGDDGDSLVLSFAASKKFDFGLDATVSYAYTESEDVSPMTSSVAGSNYSFFARTNPENPGVATSDYEIPHRFTLKLSQRFELVDGYATRVSLFASANEGRPTSYTFSRSDRVFGDSNWSNSSQLIYVPEVNDSKVVYAEGFDLDGFNQWISDAGLEKYRGQIMPRNGVNQDWWTKVDLKVTQDLPGAMPGHKAQVFFVVKNLGNLLNDEWGVLEQYTFNTQRVVSTTINDNNQFVYDNFSVPTPTIQSASLWELRLGVEYKF